jgi:hypothetical protein
MPSQNQPNTKDGSAQPSWNDADILLRLDELADRQDTREAFVWSRKLFDAMHRGEEPVALAPGSGDHQKLRRIAAFFETMGTLAKYGLINEDLLYDRWLVHPFWELSRPTIAEERKRTSPLIAENFEWIAKRNKRWVERRLQTGARRRRSAASSRGPKKAKKSRTPLSRKQPAAVSPGQRRRSRR